MLELISLNSKSAAFCEFEISDGAVAGSAGLTIIASMALSSGVDLETGMNSDRGNSRRHVGQVIFFASLASEF